MLNDILLHTPILLRPQGRSHKLRCSFDGCEGGHAKSTPSVCGSDGLEGGHAKSTPSAVVSDGFEGGHAKSTPCLVYTATPA